jgi:YVTN family beta-propeller protein
MRYNLKKPVLVLAIALAVVIEVRANTVSGTVTTGEYPCAIAIDSVTNKIYVANQGAYGSTSTVTVIDGATNSTTTIGVGYYPYAAAMNPVTNKIYVTNFNGGDITVIDGATNTITTDSAGTNPEVIAVNSLTDNIYVGNNGSNNVTVFNGTPTAVKLIAHKFQTSSIGYNGVLAVYSLNGRRILRTLFTSSSTKESILRVINKIPAKGLYKYCLFKECKVMDEGNFVVK